MKKIIQKILLHLIWKIRNENNKLAISPIKLCWDRAAESSADFIEKNMSKAMLFHDVKQFWNYSLDQATEPGLNIECGVFKGTSLRHLANQNKKKKFYGLDSFEGLNEDWAGHHKPKGSFDMKGLLPNMPDNVELIKGWVEDTYAKLLADKQEKISFLHIDTDTYSPAKYILSKSSENLQPGSIIVFDELYGYPNWQQGEYVALLETLGNEGYEFIAFSKTQAAIRVL